MSQQRSADPEPGLLDILQPDEELDVQARAIGSITSLPKRRLVVTTNGPGG